MFDVCVQLLHPVVPTHPGIAEDIRTLLGVEHARFDIPCRRQMVSQHARMPTVLISDIARAARHKIYLPRGED